MAIVTDLAINDTYEDDPSRYSIITQQTMSHMDEKYQQNNKGHMKAIREKAELVVLNNKDTVLSSWNEYQ
jgi:hypothetical protein